MTATLHESMPAETYHADPAPEPSLSAGVAKILLAKTPRAAQLAHPRLNPKYVEPEKDKFDIGTTAHALLLEDDASRVVVVKADDWRTKAAKAARDEAHAAGRTALLERQFDETQEMVAAARAFLKDCEIAADWANGKSEQTIVWEEDGIWCRVRTDRLANDRRVVADYKSTGDASPAAFRRHIVSMGYHIQEALYRRGIGALTGFDPRFVFIAQETEPPYDCALYGCDSTLRQIAEAEVERAIDLWRKCIKSGKWPGHGGRVHWANAPVWLQMEHEERMLSNG